MRKITSIKVGASLSQPCFISRRIYEAFLANESPSFGVWFCTITTAYADDEVRYSIESYVGHLQLQEDSQATFTQEITYQFQTGYHGQYVTLGKR